MIKNGQTQRKTSRSSCWLKCVFKNKKRRKTSHFGDQQGKQIRNARIDIVLKGAAARFKTPTDTKTGSPLCNMTSSTGPLLRSQRSRGIRARPLRRHRDGTNGARHRLSAAPTVRPLRSELSSSSLRFVSFRFREIGNVNYRKVKDEDESRQVQPTKTTKIFLVETPRPSRCSRAFVQFSALTKVYKPVSFCFCQEIQDVASESSSEEEDEVSPFQQLVSTLSSRNRSSCTFDFSDALHNRSLLWSSQGRPDSMCVGQGWGRDMLGAWCTDQ